MKISAAILLFIITILIILPVVPFVQINFVTEQCSEDCCQSHKTQQKQNTNSGSNGVCNPLQVCSNCTMITCDINNFQFIANCSKTIDIAFYNELRLIDFIDSHWQPPETVV